MAVLKCFKKTTFASDVESLSNGGTLSETDYLAFYVASETELLNHVVLISDYPFNLKYLGINEHRERIYTVDEHSLNYYLTEEGLHRNDYIKKEIITEGFDLPYTMLFLNYPIGLSEIWLYDDINDKIVTTLNVNIVSHKIDESEFIALVTYVESKSIYYWSNFSLIKNYAEPKEEFEKTDWQILFGDKFLDELLSTYLPLFQFDQIKSLKRFHELVEYSGEVEIDEESIIWLTQNLEQLSLTTSGDIEKIVIHNKIFRPIEILSGFSIENTDTIENQFVHGFINELLSFFSNLFDEIQNEAKKNAKATFFDLLYFYSAKRRIISIQSILQRLKQFAEILNQCIPVTCIIFGYINTNKIESKGHYYFIYKKFVEWVNSSKIKYSHNKIYFKGVYRMDKLFERACFYKFIDTFQLLGYSYEKIDEKNNIPRIVRFFKGNKCHVLYYETLPPAVATVIGGRLLNPDFILELESKHFVIFDSKYKTQTNIKKYDLADLTLKYLHGLGKEAGGYFNVLGLYALIPPTGNSSEFYQKGRYSIRGTTPVFPSIGSVIVDFENDNADFNTLLGQLLNF